MDKLWNGTPIISHQMGLEPTTFCSEDRCSAIEPLVLYILLQLWPCPYRRCWPLRLPPNGTIIMSLLLGGNLHQSAGMRDLQSHTVRAVWPMPLTAATLSLLPWFAPQNWWAFDQRNSISIKLFLLMLCGRYAHHVKTLIVIFSNNIYDTDTMTHSGHILETGCFRCVVANLHSLFLCIVYGTCLHWSCISILCWLCSCAQPCR